MGLFGAVGTVVGGFFGGPAGAAIGGSIGGAIDDDQSNSKANKLSKRRANQANAFSEYMSSTAHQREVKDLRAAGLNPILSVNKGAPMANGVNATVFRTGAEHQSVGLATAREVTEQNTRVLSQKKILQEIENLKQTEDLTRLQKAKVSVEINRIQKEVYQVEENTTARRLENVQAQILADFYASAEFVRIAKDIGISPSTLKGIFSAFFSKRR